ncbi:MAG: antibiotic biosynthesis monooxygenase [Hyphomicrobiales bacterium]|nr:antibiotic biosynthesis monooxygenase [Hyphomicrobiales bacterium]
MTPASPGAPAQENEGRYIQLAELEIDPAQIENYMAAVRRHIEAAVRTEPGVLVLYAVAHKDDPTRITVFEIYQNAEAYRAHLAAPHFKDYKSTSERMIRSLRLIPVMPVALRAK